MIACVVGAAVGLEGGFEGAAWDAAGFSRVRFVEGGSWETGRGRVAARDLQKSVLEEEDWHWAQVPGPLMQVFLVGDDWEIAGWVFWQGPCFLAASAAISAQMQGVPCVQNPQESSGMAGAGIEEVDVVVVRVEGWCAGIRVVKSISVASVPVSVLVV